MPLGPSDQGATSTLETETNFNADAQAIFEKAQKINEVFLNYKLFHHIEAALKTKQLYVIIKKYIFNIILGTQRQRR